MPEFCLRGRKPRRSNLLIFGLSKKEIASFRFSGKEDSRKITAATFFSGAFSGQRQNDAKNASTAITTTVLAIKSAASTFIGFLLSILLSYIIQTRH